MVFTDPVIVTALIAGIVAITVEFVRRGSKKDDKPEPPKVEIPTGQPLTVPLPVDQVQGRIDDLKQQIKELQIERDRHESTVDRWRTLYYDALAERNAAWDRLRLGHGEAPPFIAKSQRAISQVIPDEEALHQTLPLEEIQQLQALEVERGHSRTEK